MRELNFTKFPRTPHLFVLPGLNIRDDKVLSPAEAQVFFDNDIIVEEKVDGANVGFSFTEAGEMKIQNRGNFLSPNSNSQFDTIWDWAYKRVHSLSHYLTSRYILFGEWCYAKHSIHYTLLPDWFLGFDIYDRQNELFLNTVHRNEIFKEVSIHPVPIIGMGKYSRKDLISVVQGKSSLGGGQLEGIYLRFDSKDRLVKRAKLVKEDFIQKIDEHWSKRNLIINKVLWHS